MTAMTVEQPQFLTIDEVANILRCGRTRIYELHRRGDIDFLKFGHKTLIPRASLNALIGRMQQRKPTEGES